MQNHWPKNENIMNWDPENMDKYWELCSLFDQYPQVELDDIDSESAKEFARSSKIAQSRAREAKLNGSVRFFK